METGLQMWPPNVMPQREGWGGLAAKDMEDEMAADTLCDPRPEPCAVAAASHCGY